MTEQKFNKQVNLENPKSSYGTYEKVYLFNNYDELTGKLSWMTAYRQRDGTDFIVESGAGIPEKKMESQIMSYLRRKIKKQGYI